MKDEEILKAFRAFMSSEYPDRKAVLKSLTKDEVLELHRLVGQDQRVCDWEEELKRWDTIGPNFK